MTIYKTAIVAILVFGFLAIAGLYYLSGGFQAPLSNNPVVSASAQASSSLFIQTLDGKTLSLSDLTADGKPTLLYFGATWCPHCRADLERLSSTYPSFKNRVRLVWVDLDPAETPAMISAFKENTGAAVSGIEFAQTNQQTLVSYNIQYTTMRFVVTPSGRVEAAGSGELSADEWTQFLNHVSTL